MGDKGSIPGSRRSPGGGNGNPLQNGEFHGQRSQVGFSPWSHKELDMTEHGRTQERTEEFIDKIRVEWDLRLEAESKQQNCDNVRPYV